MRWSFEAQTKLVSVVGERISRFSCEEDVLSFLNAHEIKMCWQTSIGPVKIWLDHDRKKVCKSRGKIVPSTSKFLKNPCWEDDFWSRIYSAGLVVPTDVAEKVVILGFI